MRFLADSRVPTTVRHVPGRYTGTRRKVYVFLAIRHFVLRQLLHAFTVPKSAYDAANV